MDALLASEPVAILPSARLDIRELVEAHARTFASYFLAVVSVVFGFCLNRYPTPYVDESYFGYPALKAAMGGQFAYRVSSAAPSGDQIWAYHGVAFPRLLELLFKFFGFHLWLGRFPNFAGASISALLLVWFLNRRGYRYAGLLFAVLWCGDRALQETMYMRMEGLALLLLTIGFLCLLRLSRRHSVAAGLFLGLACLVNPSCIYFLAAGFAWTFFKISRRAAFGFLGLAALNIPLLFWSWGFAIRDGATQFIWAANYLKGETLTGSLLRGFRALQWSRYWAAAILVFSGLVVISVLYKVIHRGRAGTGWPPEVTLASVFCAAGSAVLVHRGTQPYYLVYLSSWAVLVMVIAAERQWQRVSFVAVPLLFLWLLSAGWNVMRAREPMLFYNALSEQYPTAILHQYVPAAGHIVTAPELWTFPIQAGYGVPQMTTWMHETQTLCSGCFVLVTQREYEDATYLGATDRAARRVIYEGPAFPKAGPLSYPIVLLSPKNSSATMIALARPTVPIVTKLAQGMK